MAIDILLSIFAVLLAIVGVIGCFIPVIPGPPISFLGVLALFFTSYSEFSVTSLIILAVLMVVVTVLDFLVPSYATKKFGGTKWGSRGCALGMLASLLGLQWWAIFVAPFFGALIGEVLYLKRQKLEYKPNAKKVWKAAFGAFVGMICGILIKLAYSTFVLIYVFKEMIIGLF